MVLRDSGERVVPEWIGPADRMGFMLLEQHRQRYEIASSDIRGKRVLDLGCGAGYGAHSMADSGAERVTAVDVDSAALAYAFDNYSHPAIEYIQHDATTFTPDPGAYDLVTCFEVLEHVDQPQALLEVIRSALKPTGRLLISGCVYPTQDFYRFHVRDYSKASFRAELEAGGFDVLHELEQVSVMSAADVRGTIRRHWRSFPLERFKSHPGKVIRAIVSTQFINGITHEEMMFTCSERPAAD
ncbi:methyltransferase domain-containing protein [Gordonia pseudamarae]|jgi:SAM-dependent methyltransferase|uniref:Methyltransferase domain-containing protein n=1 Tax=Gordonia pseudamarae TaxID=2831662 RepID=A0ABX6IHB7_9ACTN|nr:MULTISPECIES: class I SAM-dependent methyltransferase [Gordonia]MBD0020415.1 methyltransferase domain-containing protein [Gordonia sp. (in: high G+C Gram-positive bacteria)]QHN25728.1 methyltransferase domain-containing protein [Gordonia pseudamarae]QHN34660.1 methyltransferase domain-containing protein [Gordonia pseudamarae]